MQDYNIRRTLCVALLLCVLVLGIGSGSTASGNALIVAQGGDVTTLDPQLQGNMVTMNVVINIFDTLVTRDADMELAPGLATSWRVVNSTTWEFSLRRGVEFHNGEPFNADSVKFSIDRLLDPKTNSPIVELKTVSRVDIVDD
ncbi:MAG TPA: ABC transporter substrate-binding protein, partial [Firmicutes bacterium]|nr:ABC transporter substrate-binding protein [Bacillota bacterium]